MQTTVIFKTDKRLKEAAQKTAKRLGIPFSAVLNESIRKFVKEQQITFHAFQDAEDELWIERAEKAHHKGSYLSPRKSAALLRRMINAAN